MNEYARVLQLEFNRGVHQGNRLICDALFTAQATEPYPNAVIGNSPFASAGLNFHYGLSAWLECTPPAANCDVLSSPGAFGFTPWVDRDGGYYAILAMEVTESQSGIVEFSVRLAQDLKPLIRSASVVGTGHIHLAAGDAAVELHAARGLAAEAQQRAVALLHERGGGLAASCPCWRARPSETARAPHRAACRFRR